MEESVFDRPVSVPARRDTAPEEEPYSPDGSQFHGMKRLAADPHLTDRKCAVLELDHKGEVYDEPRSSSPDSTDTECEVEGDLGHFLQQLEDIACWDRSHNEVAVVLHDVFQTLYNSHSIALSIPSAQQRLVSTLQVEVDQIKCILEKYAQCHSTDSDHDATTDEAQLHNNE